MSPCAHTCLFICLCCEMTNCSHPRLEDVGWASPLPQGSILHPSQSTRKFISGETSGCGGDMSLPTSFPPPLASLSLRSS